MEGIYSKESTDEVREMKLIQRMRNESNWKLVLILWILIQPVVDLDYVFYETLNQIGLPRFSTIVRFLVLPALIVWTYALKEKNKKKVGICALLYLGIAGGYFYFHSVQAIAIYDVMGFTTNFRFNWYQELVYLLTLVLPFGLMYCVFYLSPTQNLMRNIVIFTSGIISVPIVISNILSFGLSTYEGKAVASFLSWFSENEYTPRQLATKFFFYEGNTVGILLFMLLPLVYLLYVQEKNQKEKNKLIFLLLMHSLSMLILGTRVATYGALLVPLYFTVLYVLDCFLKNRKFEINKFGVPVVIAVVVSLMFPYTPAVQNQKIDAANDVALIEGGLSNGIEEIERIKGEIDGEALIPGSLEFNHFYINMFEEYGIRAGFINTVPQIYYTHWYSYEYDPIFWMSIVEMDVYQRLNGRQIQNIFMRYKLEKLTMKEKILGAGYSTFMNGSIILEQDFKQQMMTLGPIGFILTIYPWILILCVGLFIVLLRWKKYFRLNIFVYGASFASGLGSAYMSGHTLDQFMTTTWLAIMAALLIIEITQKEEEVSGCDHK